MEATREREAAWLDRPLLASITVNWELVIFLSLIALMVVTRFYDLGARVMSHDESLHTYYSWLLYRGRGFTHTPLMHGPLQFHLIGLSYFLFGDNDLTARIPMVVASVLSVGMLWHFRRYLGRAGALAAALLFTISPYMLYYGRYVRNEALVVLFGLITLWAILRYLESGQNRYLFYLTAATALHFTAKETAFIYTAQALVFLAIWFVNRVTQRSWPRAQYRQYFLIALLVAFVLVLVALGFGALTGGMDALNPSETAAPLVPGEASDLAPIQVPSAFTIAVFIFASVALLGALFFLIRGYTLARIREERAFDLIILLGTLVLPHLAPFPVVFAGWDPLDYSQTGMFRTAMFLIPLALIAVAVGWWWKPRLWLLNAALFYAIFTVFYTTVFTNAGGFFTGLVGSLGYWLEQQGVRRGNQPWYYYLVVQIPVYEYLPALGSLLALVYAIRNRLTPTEEPPPQQQPLLESEAVEVEPPPIAPTLPLLGFWVVTSVIAYTIAGEKMPWLTVHIALPLILTGGWGLGQLVESIDWSRFMARRGPWVLALSIIFLISVVAGAGTLLGNNPPFQGSELEQLRATSGFLTTLVTAIASGWGLLLLLRDWDLRAFVRIGVLTTFMLLAVLTARASFLAAYINHDTAKEYLVYAHGARGVKEVLGQVKDISHRTTDGLALHVAYDNDISWPFTWYLRNFDNQHYYEQNPTRDLRNMPVVLVGDDNYDKVAPIVGQAYHQFDYIRMVWPDQDYFNLTLERIGDALTSPGMRSALFQIWLNRDFSQYAEITGKDMSLPNWNPSDRMRMYVRKDVAAKLWDYGVGPAPEEVVADPYEDGIIELAADRVFGAQGVEPGQFQSPHGLAVGPDGNLYVADSQNHRIQKLSPEGEVQTVWGSFADATTGEAPGGTFQEPWGVAVGPDGSVYVADTWNHRIQKFDADGQFLAMWGYFGQAEDPFALWGPRDVAADSQGRVIVTDTGNKRVVVYDADGNYLAEFGSFGFSPGEFDEPVGVAVDSQDQIYVADTWNQRVQVFQQAGEGGYTPVALWEIAGWFGQSLENKPYLAVSDAGLVYVTDPEGARVLEFGSDGTFQKYWGDFGSGPQGFGLASGVAVDPGGGVWVSDAGNHRLMHFPVPEAQGP